MHINLCNILTSRIRALIRAAGYIPGTESHVISRHDDVTAIITKLQILQVSCDCVGDTSAM